MRKYVNKVISVLIGAALMGTALPAAMPFSAFAESAEAEPSGLTLSPVVVNYELTNSKGKGITTLLANSPFNMKITIKDIKVKTSDIGGDIGKIDFIKSMDSFKGTVEKVEITSKGNELLRYDVTLKDCKWTSGDTSFGFMVGYVGGSDYATGSVNITECTVPEEHEDPVVIVAEPTIKITALEPSAPIRAGDSGEFKIRLKNLGSTGAYNILAEITSSDDILIVEGTGTQDIEGLGFKDEHVITVKYKALEKINSEKQNFGVTLRYYYDNGTAESTGTASTQVSVAAEISTVEKVYPVITTDFSLAEETLEADKDYSGVLTIKNIGSADIKGLFVNFTGSEDIVISDGTGFRYFEDIPINGQKQITVKFRTMKQLTSARQSIAAALKYNYVMGSEELEGSYESSFVMFGAVEDNAPLPVITSEPFEEALEAGRQYRKAFFVTNKGNGDMTNVNIIIKGSEGINITGGRDHFFEEKIAAGKQKRFLVYFDTAADLTSVSQSLSIDIEYCYDKNGTPTVETKSGTIMMNSDISAAPVLRLSCGKSDIPLVPDTEYYYTMLVKNYGDVPVRDVFVDFSGSDEIYFVEGTQTGYIDIIRPQSTARIKVKFRTVANLSSIKQSISAEMKYSYGRNSSIVQANGSSSVSFIASPGSTSNMLRVTGDKMNGALVPDTEYEYTLVVKNYSDSGVSGVFIDLTGTDDIFFLDGTESLYVGEIEPQGTAEVTVKFRTSKKLTSVKQNISAQTKYFCGSQMESTSNITLIAATDYVTGDGSAAPNLIIGQYDTGADQIAAGEIFDLSMDFFNTSSSTAIENIVMTINASGDLSIYGGSSSFYYPSLAAAGAGSETIQLRALPTAATGTSSVSVSFKYDYLSGDARNTVTSEQTLYVPVYQPDKMTFSVNQPNYDIYAGNEVYITLSYLNKGRADASNVKAELVGDVSALTTEKVIGNVLAGGNGSVDFIVTPYMPGEVTFSILLTYEDSNMDEITKEIPVTLNVMEMSWGGDDMFFPMTMEEPGTDEGGFPWWIVFVGGGLLVVAAVVVIIVVVRRKRKTVKKISADDFDWEDELDEESSDDKTKV